MSGCCATVQEQILLLPCSGASNVGQIANQAALRLHQAGLGQLFCTAAIAAGVEKILHGAQEAAYRVAIEGCGVGCVKAILESRGLTADYQIVVTEAGIQKAKFFDLPEEAVGQAVAAVLKELGIPQPLSRANPTSSPCCAGSEEGKTP